MRDLASIESMPIEDLRESVMDRLTASYSSDRISMDEFESRAEKAAQATNHAGLLVLIADLPATAGSAREKGFAQKAAQSGSYNLNSGEVPEVENLVAVFSGTDRRGLWKPARRTNVIAVFGGANFDYRKAAFPPGKTTISVLAMFGGIEVIIPRGVRVETRGVGIFGGFESPHPEGEEDPEAPVVVIEGLAFFGGVSVKVRSA
jgi:hypothetical protein